MGSRLRAIAPLLLILPACKPPPPPPPPDAPSCREACGDGTRYADGTCVIDWNAGVCVAPEKLAALEEEAETPWFECPFAPALLPPFKKVNDRKIPGHDPRKTRTQSLEGGAVQLDEHDIEQHFANMEDELFQCLTMAACYEGGHPGGGTIEFEFGTRPDGTISGVNVTVPKHYKKWGVDRCARRVLFDFGFPEYDGEAESVGYVVEIGGPAEEAEAAGDG